MGESGSGKTTIGRAAVGLLPVVEGTLTVAGVELTVRDAKKLRSLRRKVGMVFQDPSSSLNPRLPVGESIGEPMFLAGVAKGDALQKRIEELLDQVQLPRSYRNRYPHELSGGQKQRVGIARAISLSPELLVADEPTSALDVSVQATVLELLQDLQSRLKFACLFVTHDLAVVDVLADRIAVMRRGVIVEQGTRDAILRNPQEAYTQRLIAAVPAARPGQAARASRAAVAPAREVLAVPRPPRGVRSCGRDVRQGFRCGCDRPISLAWADRPIRCERGSWCSVGGWSWRELLGALSLLAACTTETPEPSRTEHGRRRRRVAVHVAERRDRRGSGAREHARALARAVRVRLARRGRHRRARRRASAPSRR